MENYVMEGIGYDFVPRVLDRLVVDDWVKIDDQETLPMARRLIREEGFFCGGSSGGTVAGALRYAKEHNLSPNDKCVVVLADNLRNYITKLVSKEWMVEKGFYEISSLKEDNHPLNTVNVEKLGLKPVKVFDESATIG